MHQAWVLPGMTKVNGGCALRRARCRDGAGTSHGERDGFGATTTSSAGSAMSDGPPFLEGLQSNGDRPADFPASRSRSSGRADAWRPQPRVWHPAMAYESPRTDGATRGRLTTRAPRPAHEAALPPAAGPRELDLGPSGRAWVRLPAGGGP